MNLEGLPLFADALGPHGSPTSDSERTMVTEATTRVLAIIISFGGASAVDGAIKRMNGLLETFCSARDVEHKIVD